MKAVNTRFGEFHGRDAIYLDKEIPLNEEKALKLTGEINGGLCSVKTTKDFIPYEIVFMEVISFTKTPLDLWEERNGNLFFGTCSFYCQDMGGELTYYFLTYDLVYEIICTDYEINFIQNT